MMKCFITKIKHYNDKCTTNFHYKGIPAKEIAEYICFPIVLIGSIYRISENHYP